MIAITTLVNSAGIVMAMLGVYMVYIYSLINYAIIDGGNANTDWSIIERKTKRRNLLIKTGVCLVLAGSFAQLVGNFI